MKISSNDLINLPVYTEAGQHLGRIISFDINIDNYLIEKFYVKTGLIQGLWHEQLIINPSQVVSITKEKMVVDNSVEAGETEGLKKVSLSPATK
ncbi:MAG: PRC-barrel domain-containing protein [Candidatus Buchananbacteria bacterium]|nr:PRC-barrel domain-containing protein [Candidatus Buchananbacteria bacterium]